MMNGAYGFVCFCSCRFKGPQTVACRDKLPVELESGKFDIRFGSELKSPPMQRTQKVLLYKDKEL